jgi:outer membrane protein
MKKLIGFLIAACLVQAPAFAMVVGKVDVQKILVSIKEGVKVRDELKGTFEKRQKELQKEEEGIRKQQEDLQKQASVLSEAARGKKEKDIQDMIVTLQNKSTGYQKELQEMENKKKKPILDKIKGIIDEVSKKSDVDVTFEASTAPVIYAKQEKDLTDEVIANYDKKYPGK